MPTDNQRPSIAIVGMGPRGLGALEALATQLGNTDLIFDVDIFDPIKHLGAGPNFSPDETELCLLNIPIREISVEPPAFPGAQVGQFSDWPSLSGDPDTFPPRAILGEYFEARYRDLDRNAKALCLSQRPEKVTDIQNENDGWWIETGNQRFGPYHEVLLTQGQPATKPDEQLGRWTDHVQNNAGELSAAYPGTTLLKSAKNWAGKNVAIRGLGLSTLDVLRILTCGLGGRFENERYIRSGNEPTRILPFSLDGHAPVPKPANAKLDAMFDPTKDETKAFGAALKNATTQTPETAIITVSEALVAPAARILQETGNPLKEDDVRNWLTMERDAPGSQETQSPTEALRTGIGMADGDLSPSIGFVIGQLWRKWQNDLRSGFNSAQISPETAKALITFDEGLKRYSYGPPVRSAKELLMLIDAELVDLRAADDPNIRLIAEGWQLVDENKEIAVSVMIDAVMPSPALDTTADPLIEKLMAKGYISAVCDGLGASAKADGQLIGQNDTTPLCMLGRMSLGSVIAVDSIHDCFGAATKRWADGVISRLDRTQRQSCDILDETAL